MAAKYGIYYKCANVYERISINSWPGISMERDRPAFSTQRSLSTVCTLKSAFQLYYVGFSFMTPTSIFPFIFLIARFIKYTYISFKWVNDPNCKDA